MDDRWKNTSASIRHENMSQRSNSSTSRQTGGFNKFANDGSFMDMFKKKMEEQTEQKSVSQSSGLKVPSSSPPSSTTDSSSSEITKTNSAASLATSTSSEKPSILSFVGKRRGGKILKTGAVKKVRKEEEKTSENKDAWSQYLDEVKKYKSQMCVDEDKTRPLVK